MDGRMRASGCGNGAGQGDDVEAGKARCAVGLESVEKPIDRQTSTKRNDGNWQGDGNVTGRTMVTVTQRRNSDKRTMNDIKS